MLQFLSVNWGTMLVAAIVLAAVVLIIVKMITDKKAGESFCGCDCKCCPNSEACHKS